MLKRSIKTIAGVAFVATLLLAAVSCGSDDKDGEVVNPNLTVGTASRPSWSVPADLYATFEYTMSVQLIPQAELQPYISDDDLMCAVVDGEVRAVSSLQRTGGEAYFPLVIAGTSGSGAVTISYYCARLARIYTVQNWQPFTPGLAPTQDGKPYVVTFFSVE
ncbi:MAG: hypothetical protein J6M53_00110 [Bacteroidaceae bacterium]|nr:hypothetical protein [Bacteroidaceae bacterium]